MLSQKYVLAVARWLCLVVPGCARHVATKWCFETSILLYYMIRRDYMMRRKYM